LYDSHEMNSVLSSTTLLNGLILGWSVAWPPGPVNAEMIRRGLLPRSARGGFWAAWLVGLGACTGDFLWALGVSAGAGALINTPAVRMILGAISLALLLFLAAVFSLGAWRAARDHGATSETIDPKTRRQMPGYLLGLTLALTSPWNIGFWLAVIGSQSGSITGSFMHSVFLAVSVVLGAIAWACVLSIAVQLGARIFSRPAWQVATQALTAIVMLYFAARLVLQLV
jgi:threonine/homoserine/homoserine lactone efflux protein